MMYLCEEEHYTRLSSIVKPSHYDIFLKFSFPKLEFEGEVTICVDLFKRTKDIQLHSFELDVEHVKLINANSGITFEPENIEFSTKNELMTLHFKNPLAAGTYRLKIKYDGLIKAEPYGLFYNMYRDKNNEDKIAVYSHFEPAYARKCFPCWDEPSFKATFKVTINVPKEYTALMNMPVSNVEKLLKTKIYHFTPTPSMSTYLVAFALGEFNYIESQTIENLPVRIYATQGKEEQGRFALDTAVKAVKFFQKYFNTVYPLPKLDLLVISNYMSDAMENWGLIAFREINLLVNPDFSTNLTKRWIALLVSHQIAHQWIGNLVTLEWWSQLWLQEALAQLTENLCVNYIFPNFEIWQHFVFEFVHTAFDIDLSKNTHPVEVTIKDPKEIDDLYDGISYNKGSAILKMLYSYVGDDSFRKGLWAYITAHSYKNANPEDFFGALQEVTTKPIGNIMSSWIKQTGYPVVKVSVTPECECRLNQEGVMLKLVQSRFGVINDKGKSETESPLWKIPITLISANNSNEEITFLLEHREMKLFIPGAKPDDWILLNPGSIGFYRVQYSTDLLKKLIPALKNRSLPVIDRIAILNDLFHLVKCGYTTTVELLKTLAAFEDETDFLVWSNINRILGKLAILISHTRLEDEFNRFQHKLFSKISTTLGWSKKSDDNKFDNLLRKLVLGQMSWLDDEKMIREARKKFDDSLASKEKIPDDVKLACYRTVIRAGGEKEFDEIMKLYKTVDTHEERKTICSALSSVKNENLIRKVLTFAMSSETSPSDTVLIVMAITSTKTGRDLLWEYYRNNWRDILDKVQNEELLTKIIERYATEPMAMEMEMFFNKELPCDESTFQNALETLRTNGAWIERDSEALKQFWSPQT